MEDHSNNFFIKYDVSPMVPHATYDESFSGGESSSELSDKEYDNFKPNDQLMELCNGDSSASCAEMDEKWSETDAPTADPSKEVDVSQFNVKPDISDGIKFSLLSSTSSSLNQSQKVDQSFCYNKSKLPEKTISISNSFQMNVNPSSEEKKSKGNPLENFLSRHPQVYPQKAYTQEPISGGTFFSGVGPHAMTANESSSSPHSLPCRSTVCTHGLDANQNPTTSNITSSMPSISSRKPYIESSRDDRATLYKPNPLESSNKTDTSQQRQEQTKFEKMKIRRERKQQNKSRNVTITETTKTNSKQLDIDTVVQLILDGSPAATKRKKSQNKQKHKLKNGKTTQPPDKEKKSSSDSTPPPPSPIEITKKSSNTDFSTTSAEPKSTQEFSKENSIKSSEPSLVRENKNIKQSSDEGHIVKKSKDDVSLTSRIETNVIAPVSSTSSISFNEPPIVVSSSCISAPISKAVVEGLVAFTDFESLNSSPEDTFQLVTSRKEKVKKTAARGNGQQSIAQSSYQLTTKSSNSINSASKRPTHVPSVVAATDKVIPFGGKSEPSRRYPAPHNVTGLPQTPRLSNSETNHFSSVSSAHRPVAPPNQWPIVSNCSNNSAVHNNIRGITKHSATTNNTSAPKAHSTSTPSARSSSTTTAPVCNGDKLVSAPMMRRGSAASKNDDVFYESSNLPSSIASSQLADASKSLPPPKVTNFPPLSNGISKISTNIKTPHASQNSFEQTVQSSRVSSQSNLEKPFTESVPVSGVFKSCRIEDKKPLSRISQPKNQQQLEYLEEKWQLFLQEFNEIRDRQPELVGTF